jgi:glyoxylase-like metal-dependent hydrolase (beta-lactamase superfamily II)
MFEISRRDLVLGSAGAALVFGLKGPVSFIGAAQAQRAADSLKYKVGDIEVFSLHEGSVERTVTEAMVKNASLDDVKKALTAAGIGPDKIDNPFTVTAIRTGGKVVLFDTGFGGNGPATVGKLADNMKAAGLDPAAVSTVVISHFHPDHISGLWVKETDAQVFPNAEILMPEVEYKFWTDPALVEKLPEANRPGVKRIQATFPTYRADSSSSSRATSPASTSCSCAIPAGSRGSMRMGRRRKPRGARSSIASSPKRA